MVCLSPLEVYPSCSSWPAAREVKDLVGVGNMSVDKLKNLLFKYEMPVSGVYGSVMSA
jgi:hypothetical protein